MNITLAFVVREIDRKPTIYCLKKKRGITGTSCIEHAMSEVDCHEQVIRTVQDG